MRRMGSEIARGCSIPPVDSSPSTTRSSIPSRDWKQNLRAAIASSCAMAIGYRAGLAICKDMHFAALGRGYGRERVNVVLEPAWDFYVDGWMSVRLAALRGLNGTARALRARQFFLP